MLWRGDECPEDPSGARRRGGDGRRDPPPTVTAQAAKIVVCGVVTGFLTGFLGVGGGFLVVPALVVVLRMPMSLAIGTSLFIIVLNAASSVLSRTDGPAPELDGHRAVHRAAIVASLVAKRVACRLSGTTLSRAFAVMLGVVGLFVAVAERRGARRLTAVSPPTASDAAQAPA